MNILILNWRDSNNPSAGGADLLTHEMAKRWVKAGNSVTLFTARYKGSLAEEHAHGIYIVRRGTWWSVYLLAFFYYQFRFRNWADIVIDEVHWFPFFARLYAPGKTILLACEVATPLFSHVLPFPLAQIGQLIESFYLLLYRSVPVMAISPSTAKALTARGFREKNMTIIPMGITVKKTPQAILKSNVPTIIFLGRVNMFKGAYDAVEAFVQIKKEFPNARLWFAGSGKKDFVEQLKNYAAQQGVASSITFYGFVSELKKYALLAQSHVLIVPSMHEGWGLVVTEANYVGTPAVAYHVPGLQDVVDDGKNGILTSASPEALAAGVIELLGDSSRLSEMGKRAQKIARGYNWDNTAERSLAFIQKHI